MTTGVKFSAMRSAEAKSKDPDCPGWWVVRLVCGHDTHQPIGDRNETYHCGQCMLDHEAHLRKIAAINKKYAAEQHAAVLLADTVFDTAYGPEEDPF